MNQLKSVRMCSREVNNGDGSERAGITCRLKNRVFDLCK
ncbi:hypothetical protein VCR20J5_1390062 [Vibrio crassostreae]|nr:hypothetical protein VCR20J5_1390062 [Vibrio crassostreae]